ncbi:MAG: CPBP family intramembrane metalloprotease [Saprospiraceae bacterium]|nr:CPBP family intramembrane metalloprotease [Saprospiraceae bacterium]
MLPLDLNWKENDLLTFLTILLSTFFFSAYWFIFASEKIRDRFYRNYPGEEGTIRHVLFTKYAGFVLMGIVPAIVFLLLFPQYSLSDYGISFSKGTNLTALYWTLGLGALIIPMNYFAARRPKTFSMYPQIRAKEWDLPLILRYSLGWCVYLFGYEFLFRGILLIPLVDTMGIWPAIAVNTALYSATHIPKGMDETIGAAPLGLILCLITLQTGTLWVAFLVHVFLALSNSLFALKFHPEFRIVSQRKKA